MDVSHVENVFKCVVLLVFSFRSLAGVSRSVTVTAAYIMTVTNLGWRDSLNCIRGVRSVANPNFGFQKQLQNYENEHLEEVCDCSRIMRFSLGELYYHIRVRRNVLNIHVLPYSKQLP